MRSRLAKLFLVWMTVLSCQLASASTVSVEGNTLYVNGSAIMTIRYGNAENRLATAVKLLQAHDDKPNARAVARGKTALLLLGDTSIFQVQAKDAALAKMSAISLAKTWASNINKALTLPALQVSQKSVQFGVGAKHRILISGRLAKSATIETNNESVCTVTKSQGGALLVAQDAGSAVITVTAGDKSEYIKVTVAPIAAAFPQYATAQVTGFPCTNATAMGAVEAAIWNQLRTAPQADLKFTVPEIGQLSEGEAKTIQVRVKATAPDAMNSEGMVSVTLRNLPLPVSPESELWYCNHPESLRQFGQVFGGRLKAGGPVRLLYHHINEMGKGLLFHAQIVNTSDRPAQILLIPGDSPIDKNPVMAGIDAADRFLRNWMFSSGEIITIPPQSSSPISFRRLGPKDTVSGLIYMAMLDGGPESVLVRADVKTPFNASGRWQSALQSDTPWRILGSVGIWKGDELSSLLSEHVYPEPFKQVEVAYQVGGRHGFVRIGQQPIARSDGMQYLDGNFGVVYTIKALMDNPTQTSANIELVFEASAGYSGALFEVDGKVLRTSLLQPKNEARIMRLKLEPGAAKALTLRTIPLSGSSYPATLSIRPIDSISSISDRHNKE